MVSGLDLAWLDLVRRFTSAGDATNVISNVVMIEAVKILHPLMIDSDDINNNDSADGINDYGIKHDNDGNNANDYHDGQDDNDVDAQKRR